MNTTPDFLHYNVDHAASALTAGVCAVVLTVWAIWGIVTILRGRS